tara:strand:- start:111 stop:281 length:171 start_codon:yes stop_codon:yes gene_type:complete
LESPAVAEEGENCTLSFMGICRFPQLESTIARSAFLFREKMERRVLFLGSMVIGDW